MKKALSIGLFAFAFALAGFSSYHDHSTLCEGFVPPNDLYIPMNVLNSGGVSEAEFNNVLDKVETYYQSVVAAEGANLEVRRFWPNGTVNASAMQWGSTWIINMYGGLARHNTITKDGFMLVACHEMGHHLAGAPKRGGFGGAWASNEGQSDYYSTLRCLRFLLEGENNLEWVETNTVDPIAMQKCQEIYSTQPEENLCARLSMAGMSVSKLFQELRKETQAPAFDTPDSKKSSTIDHNHPGTQCRLDTYFQGALCFHDIKDPLSNTDPNQGTCNRPNGDKDGIRPLCWYAVN